jgi:hypothetical protein
MQSSEHPPHSETAAGFCIVESRFLTASFCDKIRAGVEPKVHAISKTNAEVRMLQKRALLFGILCCVLLSGCARAALPAEQSPASLPETPTPTATPRSTPTATPTPEPTPYIGPPAGYRLRFADEFDGPEIDESIWGFEIGPWPYNKELENYRRENAWIEDGSLVIEARKEDAGKRHYTSARLKTQDKLDFTYGYLEVRAATPTARGTWSAIWLLPSDLRYGGYLRSGEIDVLERVGYDAQLVHATIHTQANNSVRGNAITANAQIGKRDSGFHVYAMLWTDSQITVSLDGITMLTYVREPDAKSNTWPFDVPFQLILNLAVGGSWGGQMGVDDDAFPQRMLVDYVRLYTLPDTDAGTD